ncbi:ATP-grasp fold amidoligase family protein [Facklamia sp. P12945]|uniref:ATP-grasp fold amidoligase family protein n=1 Tax=Facklamia sp. P12945 TaxID=3421950 RepID=UPI003D17691D
MDYKKIIKNRETRFKILSLLSFLPDDLMIIIQYFIKLKRFPNLNNPTRFSEKIQWYKLFYRDSKMTIAADKFKVREYLSKKNLDNLLVDLYAVYENSDEIEIKNLPKKFVMKTSDGSGTNIFCKNKNEVDEKNLKDQFKIWLHRDSYNAGREWAYNGIKPRIIVEEFLEDEYQRNGVNDYKFFCFNGEPKYVMHNVNRFENHIRNFYDIDWNFIPVNFEGIEAKDIFEKPSHLNQMVKIASILAKDFPFVRVDLYSVNKKIYFGELTFYPWTGYVQFDPDEFDFILGEKFILPNPKKEL